MGAVISAVRDTLKSADDETIKMAKETLDMLKNTADIIATKFQMDIEEVYKNPEVYKTWQISDGRMDRMDQFIGVSTSAVPSNDVEGAVQHLCKGLMQVAGGGKGDEASNEFLTGVSDMVTGCFDSLLGNASAGEMIQSKFFIIPHGFAFYRVDVKIWKYNLESKGFKDHYQSITVVFAGRAVLDVKKLHESEILAYASDMFDGDVGKIEAFLKHFDKLWNIANKLRVGDDDDDDDDSDRPKPETLALIAEHNPNKRKRVAVEGDTTPDAISTDDEKSYSFL